MFDWLMTALLMVVYVLAWLCYAVLWALGAYVDLVERLILEEEVGRG